MTLFLVSLVVTALLLAVLATLAEYARPRLALRAFQGKPNLWYLACYSEAALAVSGLATMLVVVQILHTLGIWISDPWSDISYGIAAAMLLGLVPFARNRFWKTAKRSLKNSTKNDTSRQAIFQRILPWFGLKTETRWRAMRCVLTDTMPKKKIMPNPGGVTLPQHSQITTESNGR